MAEQVKPVLVTKGDWNRFCQAVGMYPARPCPMCGAAGEFGPEPDDLAQEVLLSGREDPHAFSMIAQDCSRCGHRLWFNPNAVYRWKAAN